MSNSFGFGCTQRQLGIQKIPSMGIYAHKKAAIH